VAWIESHQELARHPKARRLARALGVSVPTAIGHLHLVWWWAMDYAEDGDVSRYNADDLADAALWEGDAETFWNSLVSAGFLDAENGTSSLHDWDDYAGRLIEKRRQDAERKRRERGHAAPSNGRPPDVTRPSGVTVPNRTVPVPDPEVTTPERTTGVVVATAAPRHAPTAARWIPFQAMSPEAQTVLDEWRRAHGKRSPPKLNPTQAAKLEAAVVDLGVDRLKESAAWSAERGIAEFHKAINAAYSKRKKDEAEVNDYASQRNGTSSHRQPVPVGAVDALAKYDD
jgi:hypothetical protein